MRRSFSRKESVASTTFQLSISPNKLEDGTHTPEDAGEGASSTATPPKDTASQRPQSAASSVQWIPDKKGKMVRIDTSAQCPLDVPPPQKGLRGSKLRIDLPAPEPAASRYRRDAESRYSTDNYRLEINLNAKNGTGLSRKPLPSLPAQLRDRYSESRRAPKSREQAQLDAYEEYLNSRKGRPGTINGSPYRSISSANRELFVGLSDRKMEETEHGPRNPAPVKVETQSSPEGRNWSTLEHQIVQTYTQSLSRSGARQKRVASLNQNPMKISPQLVIALNSDIINKFQDDVSTGGEWRQNAFTSSYKWQQQCAQHRAQSARSKASTARSRPSSRSGKPFSSARNATPETSDVMRAQTAPAPSQSRRRTPLVDRSRAIAALSSRSSRTRK